MATKIYEYTTKNGVFKWNKKLQPRQNSGFKNEITVNIQMTDEEVAQIQQKYTDVTNKEALERLILEKFGIKREVKTDTTENKAELYIKAFEQKLKELEKKQIFPKAEELKVVIDKNVKDTKIREALYKRFIPQYSNSSKIEIDFDL